MAAPPPLVGIGIAPSADGLSFSLDRNDPLLFQNNNNNNNKRASSGNPQENSPPLSEDDDEAPNAAPQREIISHLKPAAQNALEFLVSERTSREAEQQQQQQQQKVLPPPQQPPPPAVSMTVMRAAAAFAASPIERPGRKRPTTIVGTQAPSPSAVGNKTATTQPAATTTAASTHCQACHRILQHGSFRYQCRDCRPTYELCDDCFHHDPFGSASSQCNSSHTWDGPLSVGQGESATTATATTRTRTSLSASPTTDNAVDSDANANLSLNVHHGGAVAASVGYREEGVELEKQKQVEQARQVALLEHASQCGNGNVSHCSLAKCSRMKLHLSHYQSCRSRSSVLHVK